jgi:TolB-like protein
MDELVRLLIEVDGCVQGVGFRPFVYRLAQQYGLAGSVRNRIDGVIVEIEGCKTGSGGISYSREYRRKLNDSLYSRRSGAV